MARFEPGDAIELYVPGDDLNEAEWIAGVMLAPADVEWAEGARCDEHECDAPATRFVSLHSGVWSYCDAHPRLRAGFDRSRPVLGYSGTGGPASGHAADAADYADRADGFARALCSSRLYVLVDHVGNDIPVRARSWESVVNIEGSVVEDMAGCLRCRRKLEGLGL